MIVWRVEDDAGNGPYHKTNLSRLAALGVMDIWPATAKNTPGIERDFDPPHIKAYYASTLRSGFSQYEHAEWWFTACGLTVLARHGLNLRQREATQVVHGKSGRQVLFR